MYVLDYIKCQNLKLMEVLESWKAESLISMSMKYYRQRFINNEIPFPVFVLCVVFIRYCVKKKW